jgi:hypothetical protein
MFSKSPSSSVSGSLKAKFHVEGSVAKVEHQGPKVSKVKSRELNFDIMGWP